MAITYVASSKIETSGSSGSLTLTLPSGINSNDLILVLAYNWSSCSWATPSGYTLHGDFQGAGDTAAWYKFSAGSDSGASVTIDPNTSTTAFAAVALVLRGVDTGTPFDVASGQQTNTSSTTVSVDQITTATAGAWHVIATGQATSSVDATFTTPSGYTSRLHAYATGASSGAPWEVFTKEYASAGTTTPTGVTSNRNTTGLAWSIAVRPASGSVYVDVVQAGPGTTVAAAYVDVVRAGPGHAAPATIADAGMWFCPDGVEWRPAVLWINV